MIYRAVAIEEEFGSVDFNDRRLTKRLEKIAAALEDDPASSFPDAAVDDAALEATYRFLGNERVAPEKILSTHWARTAARCAAARVVLSIQDTTELRFSTARDDLGRVSTDGHGLFAHVSLCVAADGTRDPLGVLAVQSYDRIPRAKGERRPTEVEKLESWRWWEGARLVRERLGPQTEVIHVMDREADSQPLFARLVEAGERFIVRARHDRRLDVAWPDTSKLRARMLLAEDLVVRVAPLSTRVAKRGELSAGARAHPPRAARMAQLAVSAARVVLAGAAIIGGRHLSRGDSLELNAVRVHEVDPPEGCPPVEWLLLTTEPIGTIEQVERIVDAYRARWTIEEYFKALKTGCAFEKRQLESKRALTNALAVFVPLAWQLLRLRNLGRADDSRPAAEVLSDLRLRLLRASKRARLTGDSPTVRDAMLAVARLGGHIKNNGDPGWLVLGRGYERLLALEEGALLALSAM